MSKKHLIESIADKCSRLIESREKTNTSDLDAYLSSLVTSEPPVKDDLLVSRFTTKLGLLLVESCVDKSECFRPIHKWLPVDSQHSRQIILSVLTGYLKEHKSDHVIPNELLTELTTINLDGVNNQDELVTEVLFLKALFKYSVALNEACCNRLSSLLTKCQLVDPNRPHTSIYLLNKLIRCGFILCDTTSNPQRCLSDIWTNFLTTLPQVLSLEEKTLSFRALFLILRLAVVVKDETVVNSVENRELLNQAFYQDDNGTRVESRLDKVYESGQDDDLVIDLNAWCLELETGRTKSSCQFVNDLIQEKLNSHLLFYRLVSQFISFNTETVIEWLVAQESTKFLTYLVRYLKYLSQDIDKFRRAIIGDNRTRLTQFLTKCCSQIKKLKKSFPYNCDPLIKLLDKCLILCSE